MSFNGRPQRGPPPQFSSRPSSDQSGRSGERTLPQRDGVVREEEEGVRRSGRTLVPSSRYRTGEYEVFPLPSSSRVNRERPERQSRDREISTPRHHHRRGHFEASSFQPSLNANRRLPAAVEAAAPVSGISASRVRPAAADRLENRPEFEERGQTRSGARFAARNLPYFSSIRQLLSHHQRLLELGPVVSTRYVHVGRGTVLQTCIRFRSDHSDIRRSLTRILTELLQELNSDNEGFEVSITFNAILSDRDSTSFSLFFGQNYGPGSPQSRLGLAERPVVVRNLLHVRRVPTEFNLEDLVQRFSVAFDSSDLVVAKILNVVYLVHQYRTGVASARNLSL